MPLSAERAYLAELLDDFGVPGHPPVEQAFRLIEARYKRIFASIEAAPPALLDAVRRWDEETYTSFACNAHEVMFEGLLTNAGFFRQAGDAQLGRVEFGGQHRSEMRQKFAGSPPHLIEQHVREAFRLLVAGEDPVAASVLSYQRFQRAHPFYDANGRIGRLFTSFYLLAHGYYIQWQTLDRQHNRFIKLLNDVHRRPVDDHSRPAYERLLVRFWSKLVVPVRDLEGEDEGGEGTAPVV